MDPITGWIREYVTLFGAPIQEARRAWAIGYNSTREEHKQTLDEYLAALTEWFPIGYIEANRDEFVYLYGEGASLGCAANYARTWLGAPTLIDASNPFAYLMAGPVEYEVDPSPYGDYFGG